MKVFVTGSGTDIGKTWVTCRWVEALRQQGASVTALKPVMSGLEGVPLEETDVGRLLQAMGREVSPSGVEAICPWRFGPPISPDMAAARAGTPLALEALAAFCAGVDDDHVVVEGVGGVMVPLNARELVLDWMVALGWPVVVVTGSYLGALSHTLTAVKSVTMAGLEVAAVVVSQSLEEPVPLQESMETIRRFVDVPVLAARRGQGLDDEVVQTLITRVEALQ
ncbi:MAG: dethiobiotin synthase [Myxococcota bacterium]